MKELETLCLACGLCCDGSLFDNVRFSSESESAAVKSLAMPVKRSRAKTPVLFMAQPCRALGEGCACKIYAERPSHCRSFECQVFRELQTGEITLERALKTVKQGRRKAERVRSLLRQAGEADESLSLSKRFRRLQRQVESGRMTSQLAESFGELGLAVHQFDLLAHQRFYTVEE